MFFNGSEVAVKTEHKHLSTILDSKLNFQSHIREAVIKARRGIGIIRYLSKYVSWDVLDQIYKFYVRPHLYYGDIHTYPHFRKIALLQSVGPEGALPTNKLLETSSIKLNFVLGVFVTNRNYRPQIVVSSPFSGHPDERSM